MKNTNQHKHIMHTLVALIATIMVAGTASAQSFSDFFDENAQIVIVTGTMADDADRQAAVLLADSLEQSANPERDILMITDSEINAYVATFINNEGRLPTDIRIISVGGSCVNGLTSAVLDLPFPGCDDEFTDRTGVSSGEYLVHTEALSTFSTSNELTVTVLAGHDASDTLRAAREINGSFLDYGDGASNVISEDMTGSLESGMEDFDEPNQSNRSRNISNVSDY